MARIKKQPEVKDNTNIILEDEIKRLRHIIGTQQHSFKDDLEAHEKLLAKSRKENESLKAYIKALVNRNIFQRILNTTPPCEQF